MNYTPDMPRESVDRAIYHALLIWSYPSQLRFRLANDLEHPDIEFLFAQGYHKDGYQFDGKGSIDRSSRERAIDRFVRLQVLFSLMLSIRKNISVVMYITMKMKIGPLIERTNTDSVRALPLPFPPRLIRHRRLFSSVDLFSVTVHELGHSLGLMHSNIPDAIMFPYYRGYSKSIKLHSDDIAAIRKLYGGERRRTELLSPLVRSFQTLHPKY